MALVSTVVSTIYGLAALSGVGIGYTVWRNREQTGATPLAGIVAGAWWWCAVLFLASNTDSYAVSVWLQRSVYLGVALIVASVFLFALTYTGRSRLVTRRTLGLVAIHPVAVAVFVVLDPGSLFFAAVEPAPERVTGVAIELGIAFWAHALYSYSLLTVSLLLLFRTMYNSQRLYRWQFILLLLSIVVTAGANYAYIAGPVPFDTAPVGILLAAGLLTVAITRYQFIDIVPVARDTVLDNINDAVFVVDGSERLVDANAAGETLLAAASPEGDPDEFVGVSLSTLFETQPVAEEVYETLMAEGGEGRTEVAVGDSVFDVGASPIADDRGVQVGWLFIVRDVTERQRREAELRRRNEQLDRFASVVSHDLRNPLGVARGYVDLARDTGDLTHLEKVATAHDRMEVIIEDVLALAREGETVTDSEPVSLAAVAEDAWVNVDTADCDLRIAADRRLLADRERLVRVFENLLRNSVEHGPGEASPASDGGQAALTVSVGATDEGFYVADDGVGIPAEERERVFESGYSTGESGVGTGLAIVEQLAEANGWTVSVTASEEGGARIEFAGVERPEGDA